MLKSIFFTLLCFSCVQLQGEEALKILVKKGSWSTYVPDNFDLVNKLGDGAFRWSTDAEPEQIQDTQLVSRDPYIQFKPHALTLAERKTKSGLVIYKKYYTFDAKGRRSTGSDNLAHRKNFISLGCSFTLGTGLSDNETFPYFLTSSFSSQNVFNMGIYGAGANDILDDLRSFKRFQDIPKTGGTVLYTAIYDHIERSLCTLNCYRPTYKPWVLKKSNYQYDSSAGKMINVGSFAESRPVKGIIYSWLANIDLFSKINIPHELTDDQIEHYVLMLVEMKNIVKEKLNANFYFTFYPGHYEQWPRIKSKLDQHQIKYVDLSRIDLKDITDQRHSIILDGHPTSLSNYLYALLVSARLPK